MGDDHKIISILKRENAELQAKVDSLQSLLNFDEEWRPSIHLRLTGTEIKLLQFLMKRGRSTHEQIYDHLYAETDNPAEPHIVQVWICKITKKIKPLGAEIHTIWGEGYFIPPASKQILRQHSDSNDFVDEAVSR